jgi:hypothetical protein
MNKEFGGWLSPFKAKVDIVMLYLGKENPPF